MPNWTSLVRLLRRRLVLGIIFAMSLTYCAISLLSHEKLGNSLRASGEEGMLGGMDSAAEDEDEMSRGSGKHLAWQLELENNYDVGNAESTNANAAIEANDTSVVVRTCRNSVQGKSLIVDERGFVCARSDVLPTGCCTTMMDIARENSTDESVPSAKQRRYSCETCNQQGCCAIYEFCVSCCLQPNKRRAKKDGKNGVEDRRESQKARRGEDAVRLRLRSLDRFQMCLAACRTSSASVRHENTYKDPDSKHCYTLNYQRNRRDDSNNNNDGNVRVVVTSSSTLKLLIRTLPRRLILTQKKIRKGFDETILNYVRTVKKRSILIIILFIIIIIIIFLISWVEFFSFFFSIELFQSKFSVNQTILFHYKNQAENRVQKKKLR